MNISNITTGQVFKNYKELCEALQETIKGGTAKKSQLKEWERYFSHDRQGHKYIITEIYKVPLPDTNDRGLYNNLLQLLIMDYLIESNDTTVIITRNRLLLYLHMFNENYTYCSQYIKQLSKYTNINEKVIYDFYNSSDSSFRSSFEIALNNLRNKSLIFYHKAISICTKDNYHRLATEKEKETILQIEKEVLELLGFSELMQVRMSSKWYQFKNEVIKRLEKVNIKFYYTSFKITVNRKYIEKDYNILLMYTMQLFEREACKKELNEKVMTRLLENAEKRKNKGFVNGKKAKVRGSNTYIEEINTLVNLLINFNSNSIKDEIEEIIKAEEEEIKLVEELEDLFT